MLTRRRIRELRRAESIAEELRQWKLLEEVNPTHALYKAAKKAGRTFYHPRLDAFLRNTNRMRGATKPPSFTS